MSMLSDFLLGGRVILFCFYSNQSAASDAKPSQEMCEALITKMRTQEPQCSAHTVAIQIFIVLLNFTEMHFICVAYEHFTGDKTWQKSLIRVQVCVSECVCVFVVLLVNNYALLKRCIFTLNSIKDNFNSNYFQPAKRCTVLKSVTHNQQQYLVTFNHFHLKFSDNHVQPWKSLSWQQTQQ